MAGINSLKMNNLFGLGMWRAGKRLVKENFKIWTLCGQKDTNALPGRKDVSKWKAIRNGDIEVMAMDTQLKPQNS